MLENLDELPFIAQAAVSVLVFALALLVTRVIVLRTFLRIVRSTEAEWDDMLYRPVSNRLYILVSVGVIQYILSFIDLGESVMEQEAQIFSAIYILLGASFLSVSVQHLMPVIKDKFFSKSNVTVKGSNSLIIFSLRALLWFIGIFFALEELEVNLSGVLASLAVFSIILGFALQQTLGNILNSFLLAVDSPFEVGDRIEVDGIEGTVASVGILSTKVLTREEKLVVIPNNTLISTTIMNHARGGGDGTAGRISVILDIGVDYNESNDHVKQVMLEVANECPFTLETPSPHVLLMELGDFAKIFRMFVWVDDYSDEWIARDWLLERTDERFKEEHISIPYPTQTLYRTQVPELSENEVRKKAFRQRIAKVHMAKLDEKMRQERADAKEELDALQERLKDPGLEKSERQELESDVRELEKILSMFDMDFD